MLSINKIQLPLNIFFIDRINSQLIEYSSFYDNA